MNERLSQKIDDYEENDLRNKPNELIGSGVMKVVMESIKWFKKKGLATEKIAGKLEKIGEETKEPA